MVTSGEVVAVGNSRRDLADIGRKALVVAAAAVLVALIFWIS